MTSISTYHTFSKKMNFVLVNEKSLTPINVNIKFVYDTIENDYDNELYEIEIAKQKVLYFLNNIKNSIIFSPSNEWACDSFLLDIEDDEHKLIMVPENPSVQILCEVLASKFVSITSHIFELFETEITTDDNDGYIHNGCSSDYLPLIDEWMKTDFYYFTQPWWDRDDTSTIDILLYDIDNECVVETQNFANSFPLNIIRPETDNVIRHEFKPKIV